MTKITDNQEQTQVSASLIQALLQISTKHPGQNLVLENTPLNATIEINQLHVGIEYSQLRFNAHERSIVLETYTELHTTVIGPKQRIP